MLISPWPHQVKTSFWDCLPWYLCSLSVDDEEEARLNAQEALQKFAASSDSNIAKLGREHRMTQRFCSHKFRGDCQGDVPLRPMLDKPLDSI
jgi:hypothetical protein